MQAQPRQECGRGGRLDVMGGAHVQVCRLVEQFSADAEATAGMGLCTPHQRRQPRELRWCCPPLVMGKRARNWRSAERRPILLYHAATSSHPGARPRRRSLDAHRCSSGRRNRAGRRRTGDKVIMWRFSGKRDETPTPNLDALPARATRPPRPALPRPQFRPLPLPRHAHCKMTVVGPACGNSAVRTGAGGRSRAPARPCPLRGRI